MIEPEAAEAEVSQEINHLDQLRLDFILSGLDWIEESLRAQIDGDHTRARRCLDYAKTAQTVARRLAAR